MNAVWLWLLRIDAWIGKRTESISGRCYRSRCWCCKWLCRRLNTVNPNHCRSMYYGDRIRNPDLPI